MIGRIYNKDIMHNVDSSANFTSSRLVNIDIMAGGLSGTKSIGNIQLKIDGIFYTLENAVLKNIIGPMVLIPENGTSYVWSDALNLYSGGNTSNGTYAGVSITFYLLKGTFTDIQIYASAAFNTTYDGFFVGYNTQKILTINSTITKSTAISYNTTKDGWTGKVTYPSTFLGTPSGNVYGNISAQWDSMYFVYHMSDTTYPITRCTLAQATGNSNGYQYILAGTNTYALTTQIKN